MTIQTVPSTQRRIRLAANAGQTQFTFAWPIFADTDLEVRRVRAGAVTVLQRGADYTVTGAGEQAGGFITLTAPALLNDLIVIRGNQPIQRLTDFQDGGDLPAQSLDDEWNRAIINQQQLRDGLELAIRADPTDAPLAALPAAAARANRLLVFDSQGNPTTADVPGAGSSLTGNASLATRQATGTTQPRTFAEAASDEIRLLDFSGVDPTGAVASDAAVTAWFNRIKETRKTGILPPGTIRLVQKLTWDFSTARDGARIIGAGGNGTVLDLSGAPAGTQFEWQAPLGFDAFDWEIGGFRVNMGNTTPAPSALLGRLDGSNLPLDAFNGFKLDITFGNNSGADNVNVQMNGWYGCDFKLQSAGPNTQFGIALDWNYFAFNSGKLFPGGRKYGVRFGQFVFGNEFTACDFEILQTCFLTTGTSNASRNAFSGQFVWGAYNATLALDGQNGATPFAELPALGGPLFMLPATNFASGGVPNPTGAASFLLRAMHNNFGDWEAGGLTVNRPAGQPARLVLDTETGQISVIYHYRNNSLRWTEYRDIGSELGGSGRQNSALTFEARDDSGNTPINVLTLFRDGRAQVLGTANGLVLVGANAGSDVAIQAVGTDTNISARVQGKGTGRAQLDGDAIVASSGKAWGFGGSVGQTRQTLPAAATDPTTTQALTNAIRTVLIGHGFTG